MRINHQEVVHQWKKAVKTIVRLRQADPVVTTDDTPQGGSGSSQQNSREAEGRGHE